MIDETGTIDKSRLIIPALAGLMEFAVIGFILGGGGRYSLDRMIGREF
jgi:hypothetical protein